MAKKTRRTRKVRRTRRKPVAKEAEAEAPCHYSAKMMFDGKTLVSETQKNSEPAQRRVYTLKQLAREIPLAAELGKEHLGWNDRHVIQYPPTPRNLAFHSVLPNPVDLGLMPPNHHQHHHHQHHHHQRHNNTMRRMRRMRQAPREPGDYDDNVQLTVQDNDAQPRNLFDLPVA